MSWKLFFVIEVLLAIYTIATTQQLHVIELFVIAATLMRAFAVYTYAFGAIRYSTTRFWSGFRYAYVGWAMLTVAGYVMSRTAGFRYGIFPEVDALYFLLVGLQVAVLATFVWAEWTAISRLANGETAKTYVANPRS